MQAMENLYSTALLIHLIGFAAWAGAGLAQLRFMAASRSPGIEPILRDQYERLSALLATRVEIVAAVLSIASGLAILYLRPGLMKNPAMHTKLTMVALLLVLSHLEMFNARRIVRLRKEGGDTVRINDRKSRHEAYGRIGGLLVLGILVTVTFFIRG